MSEVLERNAVVTRSTDISTDERPLFKVVLSDSTGMDSNEYCHVSVLTEVFNMNVLTAFDHVSDVQKTGQSVVATYRQKDVAEMKASEAQILLNEHQEHNGFVVLSGFHCE